MNINKLYFAALEDGASLRERAHNSADSEEKESLRKAAYLAEYNAGILAHAIACSASDVEVAQFVNNAVRERIERFECCGTHIWHRAERLLSASS